MPDGIDPLLDPGAWLDAEGLRAAKAELDEILNLANADPGPEPSKDALLDQLLADSERWLPAKH
jgi:hypothetical protein